MKLVCTKSCDSLAEGAIYEFMGSDIDQSYWVLNDKGNLKKYNKRFFKNYQSKDQKVSKEKLKVVSFNFEETILQNIYDENIKKFVEPKEDEEYKCYNIDVISKIMFYKSMGCKICILTKKHPRDFRSLSRFISISKRKIPNFKVDRIYSYASISKSTALNVVESSIHFDSKNKEDEWKGIWVKTIPQTQSSKMLTL